MTATDIAEKDSEILHSLNGKLQKSRVEYVWQMNSRSLKRLQPVKDEYGNFLLVPPGLSRSEPTLLGYRVFIKEEVEEPRVAIVLPSDATIYQF